MLRSTSRATRRALLLRRAPARTASSSSSSSPPPSSSGVKPASASAPASLDAVAAVAKKNAINIPPPPGSTGPSSSSSSSSSSGGSSFFPKLLLLSVLSAPAGAAVYIQQNPTWNPEMLRGNENWIQFRELVLGKEATKPVSKPASKPVAVPVKTPSKTAEEFSQVISKGQAATAASAKKESAKKPEAPTAAAVDTKKSSVVSKVETKTEQVVKAVKAAEQQVEKKGREVVNAVVAAEKKAEKKGHEVINAVVAAEHEVEKKGREVANAVVATEKQAEKKGSEIVKTVTAAEQKAVKKVSAATADATADAKHVIEKKVDEATQRAREELDKLTAEASPVNLSNKVEQKIQTTTKEILDTLRAESNAAADDVDKNYLDGLHELDANALVIRVAQLATEMKHRSKWEAARLVEALRVMEENAQKKSAEVLRYQDELHKELLAKELRFQEELLTRKTRDETEQLKKAYAHDLARNVNAERMAILNKLQETFEREKKIIEDRYATQLRAKSKELQEILAKERNQRVAEMENYRAQLRALNTVLENSSTYEAFSHQVHKTSMAALALSDRIEAAAPLRDEIRALREAARSDALIEAALKTLPQRVIEEGAPSVSQLQERFNVVKKVAHRAALAPENSGLVGQLFGSALSLLIIPPGGPIEGADTDAVFSRADYALKAGDIESAVAEMKALSGVPADVSKDWISAAESRLAVEQTAKVVKAHVALLAASCS